METKQLKQNKAGMSASLSRVNVGMFLALFAIVAGTGFVLVTKAALATSIKDTMTNQATNAMSSHDIRITLSAGNTFATGEQVAIDFPESSAFTQGGTWATTDFSFNDGTVRSVVGVNAGVGITTVSCADGVNNVGVAIDTATLIFRVRPCGASFVASGTGANIMFVITGTSPDGTLANPAISGSYVIYAINAAGDCTAGGESCATAVSIVSSGSVDVTATVGSTCGNGVINGGEQCDDGNITGGDGCSATCQSEGGGGGPPADTTPPFIFNVAVTGITSSAATVGWNTDEASTSVVQYGLTVSYGSSSSDGAFVTSHSRPLTGLTSGTTYHYRVCSTDAASNQGCSPDATFTTADTAPPIITNVQVTGITTTGATLTWTTDENATQFVDYGLIAGPPYGSTGGSAMPLQTTHSVSLTGLTADTTYHFRVRSGDASSNEAFTADATFATLDPSAPVISDITVTGITATSAIVNWTTNEPTTRFVDYDTTSGPPYGSTVGTSSPMQTSHSVTVTGLFEATTYHYRVRSTDASSNEASTVDATFTTLDVTAPAISAVTASNITATSARITWTTNEASDSTVDHGLTVSYGATATDGALVTSHQIDLTGLAPNATHHYRVRSSDASSNEAVSGDFTLVTLMPAPPAISAIQVTNITQTSARITWTTDTPSDSTVNFGPTVAYGSNGTSASSVTNHFINLTGLAKGATYHFRVRSTDAFAQEAISGDGTFATLADTTAPANVTDFDAVPGDQQITLSWTNPADADFQGTRVLRKTSGSPTGPTDGVQVYSGNGTVYIDSSLTNGITYFYAAFAFDDVPNFASGSLASATPVGAVDTTAPDVVTNLVATAGDALVQLSWTNPSNPDWAGTRVVRKAGSAPVSPSDGTIVFDGVGDNRLDTFVTNGITYHYAAYAYDGSLNFASPDRTDATPYAGAPTPSAPTCTDTDGGANYDVFGSVSASSVTYDDSCVDSSTVTENICASGARSSEEHACGTGSRCSGGRCVPDTIVPTNEVCGNGTCESVENSISCSADCPLVPETLPVETPEPTVADAERLEASDLRFYATSARIPLRLDVDRLRVYVRMAFMVRIPDESIRKPITTAFINLDGSSYIMRQTGSFESVVAAPATVGIHPLTVAVQYEDGTTDAVTVQVETFQRGEVYESADGNDLAVSGARVSLYVNAGGGNYGLWDGSPSGQQNPQIADELGRFGFIVPTGTYKLRAEKEGYAAKETLGFPVGAENVITNRLQLIKLPEDTVAAQAEFIAKVAIEDIREIIQNPIIEEQAEAVAAPAAVAAAIANVASAGAATATAIPYLLYVYSFLAHPALLIARRRRKQWGVVYNPFTRLPVDLAIVRLTDAKTGRIVRSAVTDKDGRYFFIIGPGQYAMSVVKVGYVFPSAALKGIREDAQYVDLYHGETIDSKGGATITANIPIDPVGAEKTPRRVLMEGIGRRAQKSLGLLSIVVMLAATVITPTPMMLSLLAGNVVLYALFRRLAVPPKPKNWGIVYDEKTGKPLQNAVARIFETRFNKLLETQVTDIRGRYAFLVGRNTYYVTFEKPGYDKEKKGPVDLMHEDAKAKENKAQVVAMDIRLKPAANVPQPPEPPPPSQNDAVKEVR